MIIFSRGRRLYAKTKALDGRWKQLATGHAVGEEDKARRWLEALERRVEAARAAGATEGPLTVAGYAGGWIDDRKRLELDWKNDQQRLKTHVLPTLGKMALAGVRALHLADLFKRIRVEGKIGQRTIYNVYSVVSALFRDAVIAGLVEQTPCILTKYQLGPLTDKDPSQRGDAVFTRAEVEKLIADPRIPADRQVVYALGALAGLRHGEIAGLRWHHIDATKEPLGQLTVATSYDKGRTKTGVLRRVPVHPVLAAMLAEWRLAGWARMLGRAPGADDLVVPLEHDEKKKRARPNPRAGGMRNKNDSRKRLVVDLAALGLRHRRGHDLRATFVTLAEDDGGDPYVIERLTHTPKGRSAYTGYSRTQWATFCREVAKLQITRSTRGDVIALPIAMAVGDPTAREDSGRTTTFGAALVQSEEPAAIPDRKKWRRRESNSGSTLTVARASTVSRYVSAAW